MKWIHAIIRHQWNLFFFWVVKVRKDERRRIWILKFSVSPARLQKVYTFLNYKIVCLSSLALPSLALHHKNMFVKCSNRMRVMQSSKQGYLVCVKLLKSSNWRIIFWSMIKFKFWRFKFPNLGQIVWNTWTKFIITFYHTSA